MIIGNYQEKNLGENYPVKKVGSREFSVENHLKTFGIFAIKVVSNRGFSVNLF